ncbi:MAG: hypothetical protein L0G87_10010 [Renibacterium salmoninarum]|jgi:ppGpp synthetase/RelA/SpoT-type nucleotidyltranferase|nr:hypothetical protein [Renibacterium salmoninarum]
MEKRPWGNNALRRLGKCLRDGADVPSEVPAYNDVWIWYNDLAAYVQMRIAQMDWSALLGERLPQITSRAKTIGTLAEKLNRSPGLQLAAIQDIAGVRFEAEMTTTEQDAVAQAIAQMFDQDVEDAIKDYREAHHSGYRAVHVWLRIPELEGRIEVQVRTHLQGQWANTYEEVADHYGRKIRYGDLPTDEFERNLVLGLQGLSYTNINELEKYQNELAELELELNSIESETLTTGGENAAELLIALADMQSRRQRMLSVFKDQEQIIMDSLLVLEETFRERRS